MKKIVIMLSTYNGEKYLDEQLKSIYNQDINDVIINMFVNDDGSSDGTLSILKKWEHKLNITYLSKINGNSLGPAKSFWELLLNAPNADYYAFVDQDDIWDLDKLSVSINQLSNINEACLWFSNSRLINEQGKEIGQKFNESTPYINTISELICGFAQGCSFVFNKELRNEIIKKDYKLIPMHDTVILLHSLINNRVIYYENPLFSYRIHSNNVVAKEGKSLLQKIHMTVKCWFLSENRNSVSNFANHLLQKNKDSLDIETKNYIMMLCKSKNKIKYRFAIINDFRTISKNKKGLRSFKIRTMLGII